MAEGGEFLESSFEEYDDDTELSLSSRCYFCNEPADLYCSEEHCRRAICNLCFVRNHQSHRVVDIRKDKKNKYEALISGLSDLRRELHQSKAKIVFSMNEVDKQFADTLGTLKAAKVETIKKLTRKFNKMIKYASKESKIGKVMEAEIVNIDQILTAVDSFEENITEGSSMSYEDIMVKLRAVEVVGDHLKNTMSGEQSYQYLEYHGNQMTSLDVDRLCGSFSKNEVRVEFHREKIPQVVSEVPAHEGNSKKVVKVPTKPKAKRRKSTRKPKASPFTYKGNA